LHNEYAGRKLGIWGHDPIRLCLLNWDRVPRFHSMVNSYEKSREENRKESKYTVVVGLFQKKVASALMQVCEKGNNIAVLLADEKKFGYQERDSAFLIRRACYLFHTGAEQHLHFAHQFNNSRIVNAVIDKVDVFAEIDDSLAAQDIQVL